MTVRDFELLPQYKLMIRVVRKDPYLGVVTPTLPYLLEQRPCWFVLDHIDELEGDGVQE